MAATVKIGIPEQDTRMERLLPWFPKPVWDHDASFPYGLGSLMSSPQYFRCCLTVKHEEKRKKLKEEKLSSKDWLKLEEALNDGIGLNYK